LFARRGDFVRVGIEARAFTETERVVREWLEEQPDVTEIRKWLIQVLLAAQRGPDVLVELSKLSPSTPGEILEAFLWRARAYVLAGKRSQAIDELSELLQQNLIANVPAAAAQVRQELLFILVQAGEFDRALELAERWLSEVAPGDLARRYEMLNLKRTVLLAADRLEPAIAVLEELLAMRPHDPGVNNDLGYTWADRGAHLDRALEMIKLAVAVQPLNAAYLDSLAWVHYKREDFQAAQEVLERATQLRDGQDPTMLDHLGDAEWRLGHRAAATRAWEKASEMLSAPPAEGAADRDVELQARLRAKLAAVREERRPDVSPTAAEQKDDDAQPPVLRQTLKEEQS
jgi:tetratricopeptide (TPR) repeat protein